MEAYASLMSGETDILEQRGMKRLASLMSSDDDDCEGEGEDKQRLRDKNRTNSKRFRDRKKNYMDGLFEEKYKLGKERNDLKKTQEKLQAMLQESLAENELHRRTQGALFNSFGPSLEGRDQIRSQLLPVSVDPAFAALKAKTAPRSPALLATQINDCVALTSPEVGVFVPPYLCLLGDFQAHNQRSLLNNLAMYGIGGSLLASKPKLCGMSGQGTISRTI
jgi:hypothetical protein